LIPRLRPKEAIMFDQRLNPALQAVAPSATIKLMDRARDLAESGMDVISLAGGEPDVPPTNAVREAAIARIRSGELSYGPVAGLGALRQHIAAKLSNDHGLVYGAEQIIVGSGAKQVLFQALFAASNPGDSILIPAPYWVSYPAMAALSGATARIIATSEGDGHKLTAEGLRRALSADARWLILNSPGNPTGAVYGPEELAALAAVINEHPRLLVLCDDIYEDIVYDGRSHTPLLRVAAQLANRVLTCSGFSKGQAMTGLRVGYAAGPHWLIKAMTRLQSHLTSGGCVVGQAAAVAALTEAQQFPAERLEVYARRRDLMCELLGQCPALEVKMPDGAFYGWIGIASLIGRTTPGGTAIESDQRFAEALLTEAGLAAVPGSAFGAPGYLRLSFATLDEVLAEGCMRLVAFASACR
jgi:aspartate aminotransferase